MVQKKRDEQDEQVEDEQVEDERTDRRTSDFWGSPAQKPLRGN